MKGDSDEMYDVVKHLLMLTKHAQTHKHLLMLTKQTDTQTHTQTQTLSNEMVDGVEHLMLSNLNSI